MLDLYLTLCLCVFQPGMNGMEPAFGEAYGGHRGLLSPYPLAMSPQGGRTEYDQVRLHNVTQDTNTQSHGAYSATLGSQCAGHSDILLTN